MSELVINISKLSLGHHHRSLETQPAVLGLDARFNKPVRVEASLEKSSGQLYVSAQVTTGGVFTCDRCAEEFERDLSAEFSALYVVDARLTDGRLADGREDKEDIQVITPDTNVIDLGEDVRQYAILALPQKLLCRENCAGLCPTCGVNKNKATCSCREEEIDPRWAALKQIPKN